MGIPIAPGYPNAATDFFNKGIALQRFLRFRHGGSNITPNAFSVTGFS
jgi:hypothetical protein